MMIERAIIDKLHRALGRQSAVGILGPRQVGKTTLARKIANSVSSIYLDLESREDLQKLEDPMPYLLQHQNKLIIIDEVQRMPDLFQTLRVIIDKARQDGKNDAQFLILGSASIELIKQSSESLAGRIEYLNLSPLNILECGLENFNDIDNLWFRGGFPRSYLANNEESSTTWREDFIKTYLERDIPQFGYRIPSTTLEKLWIMLAHCQGTNINASNLAKSLATSNVNIIRYIDLLADLLLVRKIPAWSINTKKRLIKSPKTYVRDSGITHQLLSIYTKESLLSHPIIGQSWEGFIIENIISILPKTAKIFYYRTASGAEIDLIIQFSHDNIWAIEIKRNSAPKIPRGFFEACKDVKPSKTFVIYTGQERYKTSNEVIMINLPDFMTEIQNFLSSLHKRV